MDIREELIRRVSNGERFRVDLKKRKLRIGHKIVIDDGIIADGYEATFAVDPWLAIEDVFEDYYYSRPSERSEKNRHTYFKALGYTDLTDEQLICGESREVARARLECEVLLGILSGNMKWKTEYGTWYWKSKRFPQLVILKEWITWEN